MIGKVTELCLAGLALLPCSVSGFPPTVKPNVYLADNLDESQQLGYCIDISGHKSTLNCGSTQAHSCKSAGDDTQFMYDPDAFQMRAANYDGSCSAGGGGCLAVLGELVAGSKFHVTNCVNAAPLQKFVYDADSAFVVGESAFCLTVSATSRAAGPFMARDLILAECSSTDKTLKTWTAIDSEGNEISGGKSTGTSTGSTSIDGAAASGADSTVATGTGSAAGTGSTTTVTTSSAKLSAADSTTQRTPEASSSSAVFASPLACIIVASVLL